MKFSLSPSLIWQYAAVVTVNLGVVTTGMSLAWTSPVLVKLRNETETPLSRPITEEEGSWIVAGGYLIAMFCNIFGGLLLDIIGRKYCLLLAAVPKFLMALLFVFATEVWMLIAGRALMVVADGYLFLVVPIYASEIASKEHRGSLGTFLQIFSSLGIVITLSVGPYLSYVAFNTLFVSAIAVSSLPILCLPESPFYLYSRGRTEEALTVLKQIRPTEEIAHEELQEYQISNTNVVKIDKISLLKDRTFLKSVALSILLFGGSQLIGYNAVQFYLQTILESTKTSLKPQLASVIVGIIQIFASFCTPLILTRFGRKPVMIFSLSGMFLGMVGMGTFFKIRESEHYAMNSFLDKLPIISLIFIVYCFSVGMGSLVWLVTAELFEGPTRAFGISFCSITTLIVLFLTTKYFAFMTSAVGPAATYWFFSTMCVLVGTLIALFVPETKGKTFREIQTALGAKSVDIGEKSNNGRV